MDARGRQTLVMVLTAFLCLAVLAAGVIGLANLILTCLPFSKLRIAVCTLMCAGFAGAVTLLPGMFSLCSLEMLAGYWGILAAMIAGGLAVLLTGTVLLRPTMKKLETEG